MGMDFNIATMRITERLHAAESALDEALLKQTDLLSTIVMARRDVKVKPFSGQNVLMRLAKSTQTLITAGGELARVHGGLLEFAQTEGYLEECPDNVPMKPSGEVRAA